MATDRFVLKTIMEQVKDFINTFALDVKEIFDCVNIILVPFKFQAFITSHFELDLAFFLRLEHITIQ